MVGTIKVKSRNDIIIDDFGWEGCTMIEEGDRVEIDVEKEDVFEFFGGVRNETHINSVFKELGLNWKQQEKIRQAFYSDYADYIFQYLEDDDEFIEYMEDEFNKHTSKYINY